MRLIFGEDKAVTAWVHSRIPHASPRGFGESTAIGVANGAGPVAGCVYHGYDPDWANIELSIAADHPRWAQRHIIKGLLAFPFEQLKCVRIAAVIPHTSKRAIRFVKGIGFTQEGVLRRGFNPDHAVVLGMLRHEFDRLFEKVK